MATWQFDLHCLPRREVERRFGVLPLCMPRSLLDDGSWWRGASMLEVTAAFDRILVKASRTWSPDLQLWGEEDGDRIDLLSEGSAIDSVLVRIDVRSISHRFLIGLVECARAFDWIFLAQDDRVLTPSVSRLLVAIRQSDSFRFVLDPQGFLECLEKPEDE